MKSNRHPRGFTLVEILVTIAIVVTLAGLVFTVSNRAKQSAVSAKTLNNLRDIGVAATLWAVDNNNFYPPCWDGTNTYAQYLDPYMHGVEKYRSADSRFIGPNKRLPVKVNQYSHPITFTANKAVMKDKADGLLQMSKVSNPAEVIMLADGCQNPGNLNQANSSNHKLIASIGASGPMSQGAQAIPVGPDVDTSAGDAWFRYAGGKCHVVFCDGTSKTFKKGAILKRNIWFEQTAD